MKVYFRVDAGGPIGTGHAQRCRALAQVVIDKGGDAVFGMACCPPVLRQALEGDGICVQNPSIPPDMNWHVLDGYELSAEEKELARSAPLLVVDDGMAGRHPDAAMVLDQNISARIGQYDAPTQLLGPEYALLRREFWSVPSATERDRLLVTMGGADPCRVTEALLPFLQATCLAPYTDVLIGPGFAYPEATAEAVEQAGARPIIGGDVARIMACSKLAIAAAGSTCWELAALRVPMVLVPVADNQHAVAGRLQELGAAAVRAPQDACAEARVLWDDEERRARLATAAGGLVDGAGAHRVYAAME